MTSVDPQKVYLLIYSGPALGGETTILIKASNYSRLQKVMKWIAETQGLSGTLLGLTKLVYEEIMIETFDIQYVTFDQILANPYDYGQWGEDSLWAIANRDFSKMGSKRLEELMPKLNLPKLEFSLSRQRELLEIYSPDTHFKLGTHVETGEIVPVICTKSSYPGKVWAYTPNGRSVPITGAMKLAPRPKPQ